MAFKMSKESALVACGILLLISIGHVRSEAESLVTGIDSIHEPVLKDETKLNEVRSELGKAAELASTTETLPNLPKAPKETIDSGRVFNDPGPDAVPQKQQAYKPVPVLSVAILTLIMAVATGLGTVPFFFFELEQSWSGVCNGVACGVMLAASFDLIKEGQEYGGGGECVVLGILAGGAFILVSQKILDRFGDVHMMDLKGADARRMILVVAIMTLHSFGEGSGVGVSFAGPKGLPQGLLVTIAIAVHNIPEGLAVSMVMAARGVKPRNVMLWSIFTSLPQPLVAVPAFVCAEAFSKFLPICMGFAAGCMIWIVFGEVMPDCMKESNPGSVATAATVSVAGMELVGTFLKHADYTNFSLAPFGPAIWSLLFSLGPFIGGLLLTALTSSAPPWSLPPSLLTGLASGAILVLSAWRPLQLLATGKMNLLLILILMYAGAVLYMAAVRLSARWSLLGSSKDNTRREGLGGAYPEGSVFGSLAALSPVGRTVLVACASVGLQAFVEGLYLGVAAPRAQGLGMHMLLPVILHGLPRGIAVSAAVCGTMRSPRGALLAAAMVGLGGPAGALSAMLAAIDYRGLDHAMMLACGALAPAAASSLLPRALALEKQQAVFGAVLGACVVVSSLAGNRLVCSLTPYCNSAPEAVT